MLAGDTERKSPYCLAQTPKLIFRAAPSKPCSSKESVHKEDQVWKKGHRNQSPQPESVSDPSSGSRWRPGLTAGYTKHLLQETLSIYTGTWQHILMAVNV